MVGVCFLRNHVLCDSACSFCTPDSTFRSYSKELSNRKGMTFGTPLSFILAVYSWCKPFLIQEKPKFSYFLFALHWTLCGNILQSMQLTTLKLIGIHFKNHGRCSQTQEFIYWVLTQQHVFGKNGRLNIQFLMKWKCQILR
jgi:hypothetical protein